MGGPSPSESRDYQVRFVDSPEDLEQVFSQDLTSEDPKQRGSEVASRTAGAPCAMDYAAQVQAPDPHNPADALASINTAQAQASEPTVRTLGGEACLTVSLPSKSEEPSESDTLSPTLDGSGFTTPSFVDSLLASPRSPTLTELMASCSKLPLAPRTQHKSAPPEAWLWQRPSFDKSC